MTFALVDQNPNARHLRHLTGADVVLLNDGRAEASFSISFDTGALRDDGIAHVLEHMVFRGSRTYPDDQLYQSLRTGGLLSHLNAMTGPCVTSYQCAGTVAADVLRAEAVLLDAVFHPLLDAAALEQEKAIIFNEMTAHLSRPRAQVEHGLRRALFPDAPEGTCYGGDPDLVPTIRPEALRQFHRQHYRADRVLVILTGAMEPEPRLAQLNRVLSGAWPPGPNSGAGPRSVMSMPVTQARGWRLPPLDLAQRVGLASVFPGSTLTEDVRHPFLAQPDGPTDPDLTVRALRHARRLSRDAGRDTRLPAGLQSRAILAGAWLRDEPLLPAAALPDRLDALDPKEFLSRVGPILESATWITPSPVAPLPAAPVPAAPAVAPRAGGWRLPVLSPDLLPPRLMERRDRGEMDEGLSRLVLGITGLPLRAAGLAARLDPWCHSLRAVPGYHPTLLISLRFLPDEWAEVLDRLYNPLPMSLPDPGPAPHLLFEDRLRANLAGPVEMPLAVVVASNGAVTAPIDFPGWLDQGAEFDVPDQGLAGMAFDLRALPPGLALVALKAIETGLLWPRLRVEGGAYGLRVVLHPDGIATMLTAGDPTPQSSEAMMAESGKWLANHADQALLDQARLAAVAQMVAAPAPGQALADAVMAEITGRPLWSDADLDMVLNLSLDQLRELGSLLVSASGVPPEKLR